MWGAGALWVLAGVLAVAFLASGAMKLSRSKEKLAASGMGWAEDVSTGTVKLIGALEALGAIGLILPAALGVAQELVPVAAIGLGLVMAGGAAVHARRGEMRLITVNALLLAIAAVVAWGRFGPCSF